MKGGGYLHIYKTRGEAVVRTALSLSHLHITTRHSGIHFQRNRRSSKRLNRLGLMQEVAEGGLLMEGAEGGSDEGS